MILAFTVVIDANVFFGARLRSLVLTMAQTKVFRARWTEALRDAELHRYPDRAALALRTRLGAFLDQPVSRLFAANGSNEVLQTLLLTYGGPCRRGALLAPS